MVLLRLSRSFCSRFYSFFGGSGCFVSLFRWFRSGVSVVSAVPFFSVLSFRWFRFGVSGFSACRKNAGPKFGLRARHVLLLPKHDCHTTSSVIHLV